MALCTKMRPVVMVDYGGKMPELKQHLCAFLKYCQKVAMFSSYKVNLCNEYNLIQLIYCIVVFGT